MSESLILTVIAIVVAIGLSVAWILWRRKHSFPLFNIPSKPDADLSIDHELAPTPNVEVAPNRFAFFVTLLALGAAGLGQYGLISQRLALAWAGYGIGGLLFVSTLWRLTPETYESPTSSEQPTNSASKLKFWPLVLSKQQSPRPTPVQVAVTQPISQPQGPGFLNNWRYYTLADILRGRQPKLPPQPEPAPPLVTEAVIEPSLLDDAVASSVEEPQTSSEMAAFMEVTSTLPASTTIWSGFDRPESVAVAADGRVFILDTGQHLIHELTPGGQVLKKWPVELDGLGSVYRLAVAPDGRSVYVADVERQRVHRIVLGE